MPEKRAVQFLSTCSRPPNPRFGCAGCSLRYSGPKQARNPARSCWFIACDQGARGLPSSPHTHVRPWLLLPLSPRRPTAWFARFAFALAIVDQADGRAISGSRRRPRRRRSVDDVFPGRASTQVAAGSSLHRPSWPAFLDRPTLQRMADGLYPDCSRARVRWRHARDISRDAEERAGHQSAAFGPCTSSSRRSVSSCVASPRATRCDGRLTRLDREGLRRVGRRARICDDDGG